MEFIAHQSHDGTSCDDSSDDPPGNAMTQSSTPDTSLRYHQPRSFFCLPPELRTEIYRLVLRPDVYSLAWQDSSKPWTNAIGVTGLLILNRTIYSEAIFLLRNMEVVIGIEGAWQAHEADRVFRCPFANGKPNLFRDHLTDEMRGHKLYVPANISLLEFVKLRKFTLHIIMPTDLGGGAVGGGLEKQIRELCDAMQKTLHLEEIELHTQPFYKINTAASLLALDAHYTKCMVCEKWKRLMSPLIRLAIGGRVRLTAEKNPLFVPRERKSMGDYRYSEYEQHGLADYVNGHKALQVSNRSLLSHPEHTRREPEAYSAVPECRHCLQVFANETHLRRHLYEFPNHSMKYVRHGTNSVSTTARCGGSEYTCLHCASGFDSEPELEMHCVELKHFRDGVRQGIIPRYEADNETYQCKGTNTQFVVARMCSENDCRIIFPRGLRDP